MIRHPSRIPTFPEPLLKQLEPVLAQFEFRVTPYYSQLIDWSDPFDPLRKIVLPDVGELGSGLAFDPSEESLNTRTVGLQHKYGPTALLLVTDVCAAYCRFCFRKRFTLATEPARGCGGGTAGDAAPAGGSSRAEATRRQRETTLDISGGLAYIAEHPEITNVLLSGGDPLMLSAGRLQSILIELRKIPHVRSIRLGSKVPAFDPERITSELIRVLGAASDPQHRIYLAAHFSHPRELTTTALTKLERLLGAGVIVYNQTPILRGVNDDADRLTELLQRLSDAGVAPYYLFQCRPVNGNERFAISLQEGVDLVQKVRVRLSGLAKRFRYVASHATGKIEIVGIDGDRIVLRYHQARDPRDDGRIFTQPVAGPVYWLDDAVAALRSAVPASGGLALA